MKLSGDELNILNSYMSSVKIAFIRGHSRGASHYSIKVNQENATTTETLKTVVSHYDRKVKILCLW